MKRVVSNASPVSCLISLGRLEMFGLLFDQVILPEAVYEEVQHHPRSDAGSQLHAALSGGILRTQSVQNPSMRSVLLLDLDPGEAEAICVSLELGADTVLMDEKDGRKMARRMGLECKGTLWVLSQAKQKGIIPSLGEALNTLVHEYSFALDRGLIREACRRVGEE